MPDAASQTHIQKTIAAQRRHFERGATLCLKARLEALASLQNSLMKNEQDIYSALGEDLGKTPGETYLTELGLVIKELGFVRKNLKKWMRPRKVATPIYALPGKSRIYAEPYGVTLNISPWNYPLNLALVPMIDALAAGNCVILKPSSKTPATADIMERIIKEAMDSSLASVVQGDSDTAKELLEEHFDFIMYTGSSKVGKSVMQAAANHLTPVCLELGGKSPTIVLEDANLKQAARSIAWGKALNAGQTCIAPDYVLADASVKSELVRLLEEEFLRFPGPQALKNEGYAKIISRKKMEELVELSGGKAAADYESMRIAPLVMPDVGANDAIMQEEIFGPLLPVLEINGPEEATAFVNSREKPLAAYIFTASSKLAEQVIRNMPFGGGCVNDTMMHMSNPHLPFGGVGNSGMGRYHGRAGFDLFSNHKAVMHKRRPDLPLRYPPFSARTLFWLKKLLR